jgi:tetratricopeptide (TPR) repeat protein
MKTKLGLRAKTERNGMKRFMTVVSAALLAASVASAQTNTAPGQTPAPSSTTQQSQTAAPGPASGAQAAPPAGGHRVLQAKSKEEMQAYQDAFAIPDPAAAEAAADAFSAKYPTSELRVSLYMRVMNLFGQANNTEKVIATGRQAIAADPTNPVPLVQVASALAESTRDTDLDREQRLAEAAKDAQAAIDNLETGLLVPSNADPVRVEAVKHSIRTMAYDTLGMVDLDRNDYAAAVTNLQKAIDESNGNPEGVLYLRLSVAQDKLQQLPQALDSANKAVQYSQAGSTAMALAKQQQERLQKLINAGSSEPKPGSTSGATQSPTAAPSAPASPPSTSTAPH